MALSTDVRLVPANDQAGDWDLEGETYSIAMSRDEKGTWFFWAIDIGLGNGDHLELGGFKRVTNDAEIAWLDKAWHEAGGEERDGA